MKSRCFGDSSTRQLTRSSALASHLSLKSAVLSMIVLVALTTGTQAANIEFVQNGGFELITLPESSVFGNIRPEQQVLGWTHDSPNPNGGPGAADHVVLPGTADTTGIRNWQGFTVRLAGPGTGDNNGLTATSPAGGNYLALDGDPIYRLPITQTISGLLPGESYMLSFWWGAAQYNDFLGDTTEQVQVSLGDQTFFTEVLNNPSQGFQPWRQVNFTFNPTNATEVLSFLAIGTPSSLPPMVLLDGVSLVGPNQVIPEPSTWALMFGSLAGIAGFAQRRRK